MPRRRRAGFTGAAARSSSPAASVHLCYSVDKYDFENERSFRAYRLGRENAPSVNNIRNNTFAKEMFAMNPSFFNSKSKCVRHSGRFRRLPVAFKRVRAVLERSMHL